MNFNFLKNRVFIYIVGIISGIILTILFAVIFTINSVTPNNGIKDDITYFENPISYEDKSTASFEVMQVVYDCALATEKDNVGHDLFISGKTVLLDSDDTAFYDGQIININNPQQIGIFRYKSNGGMDMTVPVIYVPK